MLRELAQKWSRRPAGPVYPTGRIYPAAALLHPLWLFGLGLWLVNDHLLKGAGVLSGVVTGKLSDVACLLVLPVFVAVLARVRTVRGLLLAHVAAGVMFAALQLSEPLATLFTTALRWLGIPSQLWCDPTDLLTLPALLVSWRVLLPAMAKPRPGPTALRRAAKVAAMVTTAACCVATSSVDDFLDSCQWPQNREFFGPGCQLVTPYCEGERLVVPVCANGGLCRWEYCGSNHLPECLPRGVPLQIEVYGRLEAAADPPDCAVEAGGETICEPEPGATWAACAGVSVPWCAPASLLAVTSSSAFVGWYDYEQLLEESPAWGIFPDPAAAGGGSPPCYLDPALPCRAVFGQSAVVTTVRLGLSGFTVAAGTPDVLVFAGRASGDVELGGTVYSLGESSAYVAAVGPDAAPLWLLPLGGALTPVALALSPAERSLLSGTLLGTLELPSGSVSADLATPLVVQLSPAGEVVWHRLLPQLAGTGWTMPAARGIAFVSDGYVLLGQLPGAGAPGTIEVRKLGLDGQDAWSLELPVPAAGGSALPYGVYATAADEIWVAWQIWDGALTERLARISADGVLGDPITLAGSSPPYTTAEDVLVAPAGAYLLRGSQVEHYDLSGAEQWTLPLPTALYSGRLVPDDHGRIVVAGTHLVGTGTATGPAPPALWTVHALSAEGDLLWSETELDPVAHSGGSGHSVAADGRVLLLRTAAAADAAPEIRAIVLESGL